LVKAVDSNVYGVEICEQVLTMYGYAILE